MDVNVLIAIFTVLLMFSMATERFIEIFKPLLEKINIIWQPSAKIFSAIVVGFGLSEGCTTVSESPVLESRESCSTISRANI